MCSAVTRKFTVCAANPDLPGASERHRQPCNPAARPRCVESSCAVSTPWLPGSYPPQEAQFSKKRRRVVYRHAFRRRCEILFSSLVPYPLGSASKSARRRLGASRHFSTARHGPGRCSRAVPRDARQGLWSPSAARPIAGKPRSAMQRRQRGARHHHRRRSARIPAHNEIRRSVLLKKWQSFRSVQSRDGRANNNRGPTVGCRPCVACPRVILLQTAR